MINFSGEFVGYIEPAYKSDTLKTFELRSEMGGTGCFFTVSASELYYDHRNNAQTKTVFYSVACYDTAMTAKVLDLFKTRAHVKIFVNAYSTRKHNGKLYSQFTLAYIEPFTPETSATPEEQAVLAGLTT